MLLPLHDKNSLKIIPFQLVTFALIIICTATFLYQKFALADGMRMIMSYGVIPSVLFEHRILAEELMRIPPVMTLLSSMFLHGGWIHLLSNLIYLWIFGDNVEDSMGHWRFLFFYLICGLVAALTHAYLDPMSSTPLIGASGAIAGVIGAYLLLHPRVNILVLFFKLIPIRIPAYLLIGIWVAFQIYNVIYGVPDYTAWWAHIGGFVCGVLLIPIFKRASVPLFDHKRRE